jgi:hypothetical protein
MPPVQPPDAHVIISLDTTTPSLRLIIKINSVDGEDESRLQFLYSSGA